MWRRPRRRESPTLRVVSARCVWQKLNCFNPSPDWFNPGPQRKVATNVGTSIYGRRMQMRPYPSMLADSFYERNKGRTGCLEHIVTHSAEKAGSPKQEQSCMATEAQYYSRCGCNGSCRLLCSTGRRISTGNCRETFPVWEEVGQRNQEKREK